VIPKDVTMKELNESIEEEGKGSIHHSYFLSYFIISYFFYNSYYVYYAYYV